MTMSLLSYLSTRRRGLSLAFAVIVLDAATKAWALKAAFAGQLPIPLHPYLGTLTLAFNPGMSFSLLNDQWFAPYLLGTLAVVASAWFTHWLGEGTRWLHQGGLGLIIGGALGNLLDRLQHGAVVDFFVPTWQGQPYFTIFNVADACISVGVVLLLLDWMAAKKSAPSNN